MSKYAEPWAATLSGLKTTLEERMEKVFEIYIKTTPERLWEAITDAEMRSKYNFGVEVSSDWTPGSLRDPATVRPGGSSRGREPRGRSAAQPRPELHRALER